MRLISYSYYAKYAQSKNYTLFRHIDMNVMIYLNDDHDDNIIQDSISLDDEEIDECTIIVSRFHKNIRNWWHKIENRERILNNHVTDLNKIWLKEDADLYEDFVFVSCSRDVVRITFSKISHDSIAHSNQNIRKTMLSWYVDVDENELIVNNEKSNQWLDLIKSHLTHETFKLTSFDLKNRYDVISYRFSPSTQLNSQSSMTNAIVCKIIWKNLMILTQAAMLFERNRERIQEIILTHRFETLKAFKIAFQDVRLIEKLLYENSAYFSKFDDES